MAPLTRTAVLIALLAAYIAVLLHAHGVVGRSSHRLDPLTPRPRAVEQAIGERRFGDALPVARELRQEYPDDPLPDYWLAMIYRGGNRSADEVDAWERYAAHSSVPAVVCPALPEAYERLGQRAHSLEAYQRCTTFDPMEPQRFIDLAGAYQRDGQPAQAIAAYRHAANLDPNDPSIAGRIQTLTSPGTVGSGQP